MPIGIVSGFGRCGTTLVMNMLKAGGIHVMGPAPAFEPPQLGIDSFDLDWVLRHEGAVMKYIDPTLERLPQKPLGPVIWLDSDPMEQAKSQAKMLSILSGVTINRQDLRRIKASFVRDRPKALRIISGFGNVTRISFEDILENPGRAAITLAGTFKGLGDLDTFRAASVVLRREATAMPDLAIESHLIQLAQ
ncbi:MAG: hypothetical protein AAFQ38_16400 [Pseudomonadota bacterium]